jgi:hypothetical protein
MTAVSSRIQRYYCHPATTNPPLPSSSQTPDYTHSRKKKKRKKKKNITFSNVPTATQPLPLSRRNKYQNDRCHLAHPVTPLPPRHHQPSAPQQQPNTPPHGAGRRQKHKRGRQNPPRQKGARVPKNYYKKMKKYNEKTRFCM